MIWCKTSCIAEVAATNAGYGSKEFAYKGVFRCGHCLCQMTSEIKKERYIYYHCTGQRGPCPGQKSVREEAITEQLTKMLEGLVIEPEVLAWLKTALQESLNEQQSFQHEQLSILEAEEKKLRRKLEQLYIDEVNGVVPESAYPTLRARWNDELANTEIAIRSHKVAERSYFADGVSMLELASSAHLRFKDASPEDRRALLRHLGSNFLVVDGKVHVQLRKPFDLQLKASQNERENGEKGIWWAQLDSN